MNNTIKKSESEIEFETAVKGLLANPAICHSSMSGVQNKKHSVEYCFSIMAKDFQGFPVHYNGTFSKGIGNFPGMPYLSLEKQTLAEENPLELHEIISAMLLDASLVMHNETFQDYCDEMGANSDSIMELEIYEEIIREKEFLEKIYSPKSLEKLIDLASNL